MKRTLLLGLLALATSMFTPTAQAVVIVYVDGDAGLGWFVDTDALTATPFTNDQNSPAYAIAINNSIIIGGRDDDGATEYNFSGNPTGNSWTGGGNFSQLLDGTSDGVNNFGVECCGSPNSVTIADLTWENQAVLFDIPFLGSGITYDSSDDSFYISDINNPVIYHYSMAGALLDQFPVAALNDPCCLAMDDADGTLWVGDNGSNVIAQYSTAGVLLNTVTIPGWSPSNQWGGELLISGNVAPAPTAGALAFPVPSLSRMGLLALLGLFALTGLLFHRRF